MVKISQYTSISTLADEDLFDTSQYDPVALDYSTKSISYEDMVESIKTSIYASDTKDTTADPNLGDNRVFFYIATGPGGTLNLPTPVAGRIITVVRIANAGVAATIVGTGGAQINGGASIATDTALYSSTTCYCDGANWFAS